MTAFNEFESSGENTVVAYCKVLSPHSVFVSVDCGNTWKPLEQSVSSRDSNQSPHLTRRQKRYSLSRILREICNSFSAQESIRVRDDMCALRRDAATVKTPKGWSWRTDAEGRGEGQYRPSMPLVGKVKLPSSFSVWTVLQGTALPVLC
jgi:hypothetical protein